MKVITLISAALLLVACAEESPRDAAAPEALVTVAPRPVSPEESLQKNNADTAGLAFNDYKTGDLIFQQNPFPRFQNGTKFFGGKYNNVGIINVRPKGRQVMVLEVGTKMHSQGLEKWIARGEDRKFVVKRLNNYDANFTKEVRKRMVDELRTKYKDLPSDGMFEWTDEEVYPAEMVWKLYQSVFGIELAPTQGIEAFSPDAELLEKVKKNYGGTLPAGLPFISVDALFQSNSLTTVYQN